MKRDEFRQMEVYSEISNLAQIFSRPKYLVGLNFSRPKFIVGPNFSHQLKI